jgi:pimeloyl-ACP methyl ester carboxylesterase
MSGSAQYMEGPWRYERIEGAGHWLQLDAAERINALLLDYLASAPGRTAGTGTAG